MKLLTVLLLGLFTSSAFAQAISCREAVVLGNMVQGKEIEANSFSIYGPEDMTMGPEEFNILSVEEQEALFLQYTPIQKVVEETQLEVFRQIKYIESSSLRIERYKDALEILKEVLYLLYSCEAEK